MVEVKSNNHNAFLDKDDLRLIRGALLEHQIDLIKLQDEIKYDVAIAKYKQQEERCEVLIQHFRELED